MKIPEHLVPSVTQTLLATFKTLRNTIKIPLVSFKPDNTNPSNSFQVSNHKNITSSFLATIPLYARKVFIDSAHTISIIDVAFSTP